MSNNNPRRFDREAREICWSNVYIIIIIYRLLLWKEEILIDGD